MPRDELERSSHAMPEAMHRPDTATTDPDTQRAAMQEVLRILGIQTAESRWLIKDEGPRFTESLK